MLHDDPLAAVPAFTSTNSDVMELPLAKCAKSMAASVPAPRNLRWPRKIGQTFKRGLGKRPPLGRPSAGDGARTAPSAGRPIHAVARGMPHSWDSPLRLRV